tara:strand:+ start:3524 stop:3994 length:471 start_codon:yes stop_codon:yes gene_type:complete
MVEYINRYNDKFTFTKQEDGSVLWEGNFQYTRVGYPNVYKIAYQQYCKDGGELHIEDFIEEVHRTEYPEAGGYVKSEINEAYATMVFSDTKNINMVDPSGGPYITAHSNLGYYGKELKGLLVSNFIWVKEKEAYEIQTYGEFDHLKETKTIGGLTV